LYQTPRRQTNASDAQSLSTACIWDVPNIPNHLSFFFFALPAIPVGIAIILVYSDSFMFCCGLRIGSAPVA
jgi:hypothetical protein